MIYISTGGFSEKTAYETCIELYKNGIRAFELSGGKASKNYLEEFKNFNKDASFSVHNYFPPPEVPFVLNLASNDPLIYEKSQKHIINSINLSNELNAKYYSFHAGFLMDPKVEELGQKVNLKKLFPREKSLNLFIKRVNQIADYALKKNIEILIENNVISHNNFLRFKDNPFLMADAEECIEVMKNTNSNVNLLIDVGHLKVSSNSLKFDREEFLTKCSKWIKAIHLSDNDGKSDSNQEISVNSWFWPFIKKDLDYYSLEIYNKNSEELLDQLSFAKSKLS